MSVTGAADASDLFSSGGEVVSLARELYRSEVEMHGRWPSVPDLRAHLEEEYGYEVVGVGSGRLVADVSDEYPALDGHVVKFALPAGGVTDGRVQNVVESAVFDSDHWLASRAVPHTHSDDDGYVVAQPFCSEPSSRGVERAAGDLAGNGVTTPDFFDVDNWGLHRGEARLIDYGFLHAGVSMPPEAREAAERVADEEGFDLS